MCTANLMLFRRPIRILPFTAALLLLWERGRKPRPPTHMSIVRLAPSATRECNGPSPLPGWAAPSYRLDAAHVIEDFSRGNPFYHSDVGYLVYRMDRKDGAVSQRRWRIGPDGREIAVGIQSTM